MVKLTWLYYDLLDLYADVGNIKVIEDILTKNGLKYQLNKVTVGDDIDLRDSDMIFIGGGADFEQSIVYEDLLKRKENFMQAILNDCVVLAICGGYQLMGKYYLDSNNNKIPGLGLFSYHTSVEADLPRMVGYIDIVANILGKEIEVVGFENHSGATKKVKTPFGKVLMGYGNNHHEQIEGVHFRNTFGTYLHGPVLTRNREFAVALVQLIMNKKAINKTIEYENEFMDIAHEEIIKYVENGKFK